MGQVRHQRRNNCKTTAGGQPYFMVDCRDVVAKLTMLNRNAFWCTRRTRSKYDVGKIRRGDVAIAVARVFVRQLLTKIIQHEQSAAGEHSLVSADQDGRSGLAEH